MNEYEPDPLPTDMEGDMHVAYSKLLKERDDALLQFEEARKIIAEVSYSPEFKKWFYGNVEQDPCGVHAFTEKYKTEKRVDKCPKCGAEKSEFMSQCNRCFDVVFKGKRPECDCICHKGATVKHQCHCCSGKVE